MADPGERSLDDPAFGKHGEAMQFIALDDRQLPGAGLGDGGRGLLPPLPASAKINLMKGKKRRVRRLRTSRAPSRSCIAAEWTTTFNSRPSVSNRICRLRPVAAMILSGSAVQVKGSCVSAADAPYLCRRRSRSCPSSYPSGGRRCLRRGCAARRQAAARSRAAAVRRPRSQRYPPPRRHFSEITNDRNSKVRLPSKFIADVCHCGWALVMRLNLMPPMPRKKVCITSLKAEGKRCISFPAKRPQPGDVE